MKTSTTSAVLPCTPDAFWASFLDESYLRALYLDELESARAKEYAFLTRWFL